MIVSNDYINVFTYINTHIITTRCAQVHCVDHYWAMKNSTTF